MRVGFGIHISLYFDPRWHMYPTCRDVVGPAGVVLYRKICFSWLGSYWCDVLQVLLVDLWRSVRVVSMPEFSPLV